MKKSVIGSFVMAALLALTSCGAKETNEIKIGGIFPLSGAVAVYGVECKNGIDLAIEEINAAGGINGKNVVLISEDDEGNPDKTVNAYQKLTSKDGAKIIIGSLTSGCTQAITNRAQAQKVVQIAPAATAPAITDAGDYIFRACFIDPFQGRVGGKFSAETLNAKTAAILYDTGNDYSVGLTENFEAAFTQAGGKIVAKEAYTTNDKDFNAQLTKIKSANPDVVYLPDYYNVVALIANAGAAILYMAFFPNGIAGLSSIKIEAVFIFVISLFLLMKKKMNPIFVMLLSGVMNVIFAGIFYLF